MGAWIETVCGKSTVSEGGNVASYMGAWIETLCFDNIACQVIVASYMGAWIETYRFILNCLIVYKSHPTWVRGLKPYHVAKIRINLSRILHGCVD